MWVAHKLSLHEPIHPSTPTAVHRPTRRSEVSGPQEIYSIQQWCYHQRGRSRLCLGALCHLPQFKIPFFVTVWSSSASAASYRNIHSKLRSTMWLANRASWGALPSLIPGHTQNKYSLSTWLYGLSHIKSGPFGFFDLTVISHVIDSPRDLFFSPISDSVSTFSANSLGNTRHSPPALLFGSPPLPSWSCLVSDPSVFVPLWPPLVYFVRFDFWWLTAILISFCCILALLLSTCIYNIYWPFFVFKPQI